MEGLGEGLRIHGESAGHVGRELLHGGADLVTNRGRQLRHHRGHRVRHGLLHDLADDGAHALREGGAQLGGDLRGDRVHDLSGDIGTDLGQGGVVPEGLRQVRGELVGVNDLVRGDGRSQLLEHLGLREVGRGQGREVRRAARLDLLAGVVLEALGDLGSLCAQVVGRAILDGSVGQSRANDRLEVDVGQLRQVLAQLPEVEAGQVEGHTGLGAGLRGEGRQVDGRQIHARHVEVGEI